MGSGGGGLVDPRQIDLDRQGTRDGAVCQLFEASFDDVGVASLIEALPDRNPTVELGVVAASDRIASRHVVTMHEQLPSHRAANATFGDVDNVEPPGPRHAIDFELSPHLSPFKAKVIAPQ